MIDQSSFNLVQLYENKLDNVGEAYLRLHQNRFNFLTAEVKRLAQIGEPQTAPIRLLDVGPHLQTVLFRKALGPDAIINSLGWEIGEEYVPKSTVNQHYTFDLNDSPYVERWRDAPQHDILVMAEVFEHIHTAPEYFLSYLRTLLKPGGYLLIGTPNAVSLSRRMGMLTGANPFEKIRTKINNPGHFREYTTRELESYAEETGFTVESSTLSNFYPSAPMSGLIKNLVPQLRDSIHIVFQKTPAPDAPYPLILW